MTATIKVQIQQVFEHEHKGIPLKRPAQVIRETAPLGPTGHLLHKATLPRLELTVDLPNT